MRPGTSEVRHYHQKSDQFFYVLSGVLAVEVNGQHLELQLSQGIAVNAGQPHQIRNTSAEDTSFLVVSSPPSHGDRVLAEPAEPPG